MVIGIAVQGINFWESAEFGVFLDIWLFASVVLKSVDFVLFTWFLQQTRVSNFVAKQQRLSLACVISSRRLLSWLIPASLHPPEIIITNALWGKWERAFNRSVNLNSDLFKLLWFFFTSSLFEDFKGKWKGYHMPLVFSSFTDWPSSCLLLINVSKTFLKGKWTAHPRTPPMVLTFLNNTINSNLTALISTSGFYLLSTWLQI